MNNDRRTFLDGSTAPRKPLPAPLTEGAMKAAMEDWLEALPKPAVKEFFGVQKKFPNPKDKKMVDAKNLEILKKYKIKPLINDPSHRESLGALSCCLDMLVGGQGESVEVDGDSIEEVTTEAKMIDEVSQRKIKGLIAGRKRQADAAGDQLANVNKAYLGVTGKPKLGTIHPKTAGTVGKATQGDDRLIDAGNVFRKQEMIARRKQWDAEWRLKGNKGKDPRNEEVTTNEYTEPVTEAKKIKYPADLEHKNHRDMTPAEKQRWIAYNRAYTQAVSSRDFSGIETSPSLGTKSKEYQDAWKAWNKQKTAHAAKRNFHLIKPFVAPKEKTKKTKDAKQTKKPYFMDYPNKY